jgi:enediyne biosynthesis protein CalE3
LQFVMSRDLLKDHQWCISDPVAMSSYREAIHKTVRPGDIVLDLGAGTGILSYFACQAGAAKVYAVEPTGIIALIPQLAADNGFADRVVVMKAESFDIELPERADVMIASMLGSGGIGNNMIKVVLDARQRLLKPGGAIIPQALQPCFCPVELREWYQSRIECWQQPRMGFHCDSIRSIAVNQVASTRIDAASLLATPQSFNAIPLSTVTSANIGAKFRFQIESAGTLHALAGWVKVTMADGIQCSDSPLDAKSMPWDQLILPLDSPVSVHIGDSVEVGLRNSGVSKDVVLLWDVWVRDAKGVLRGEFHQSSFHGFLLAKDDLVTVEAGSAPARTR